MLIPALLFVCAVILELLFLFLGSVPNHSAGVVQAIQLQFQTHIVYLVSVYLILRRPRTEWKWVVLASLVFRLTLWTAYPMLSDDVYRYRWEGRLQAEGGNPYQVRPNDPAWSSLRDSTFPEVGSKDVKAGYGPLIELEQRWVNALVSRFSSDPFVQVFWYKLPAALCDLLVLLVLLQLLRVYGMPPAYILLYAWCPTPIVEFWWNGHNDAIPILFVTFALLMAAQRRWTSAFVSLSFGVAAKFWPVLLFPAFVLNGKREPPRWWQWAVIVPVITICTLPFWSDVTENAQFMSGFIGGWRNNDSVFGGLLWLARDNQYIAKYMAETLIALVSLAAALLPWRLESACLATLAGTLLISANLHPWYLAWLAPLLPFAPWVPVLLWMALEPLGYSVVVGWKAAGIWNGSAPIRWLAYVPTFVYAAGRCYLVWRRSFGGTRGANLHRPSDDL